MTTAQIVSWRYRIHRMVTGFPAIFCGKQKRLPQSMGTFLPLVIKGKSTSFEPFSGVLDWMSIQIAGQRFPNRMISMCKQWRFIALDCQPMAPKAHIIL
ncbi:MAG: hypothetical protein PVH87_06425, partial [Desulfobacteraceae bacterium]